MLEKVLSRPANALKKISKDGFLFIPGFFSTEDLAPLQDDLDRLICAFSQGIGLPEDKLAPENAEERDRLLVRMLRQRPELQPVLYDRLQMMPSLLALPSHPKVLGLSQEVLGVEEVGVWPRVQLRFDRMNDEKNLIGWHTDHLYNQGTEHSYTFWIPIVPISREMGLLLFARNSHTRNDLHFTQTKGERRFHYDLDEETLSALDIFSHEYYSPGDLVLFHSRFVHSGQLNEHPDRARLTVLFRMQDLNQLEVFQS